MAPKGKEASLTEIAAAAVAGVPGLEGAAYGDRWEGETDGGLQIRVYRERGRLGFTLAWAFFDAASEKHQKARRAVRVAELAAAAKEIFADALKAVPTRLVERPVLNLPAAAPDPALVARAAMLNAPPPDFDPADEGYPDDFTGEPVDPAIAQAAAQEAEYAQLLADEARAAAIAAAGEVVPVVPSAAGEHTEVPDEQSDPDVEEAADPADAGGVDAGGVAGGDVVPQ